MRKLISVALMGAVLACGAPAFADEGGAPGVVKSLIGGAVAIWNNVVPGTLNVVNDVVHAIHSSVHEVAKALKVELKSNGG